MIKRNSNLKRCSEIDISIGLFHFPRFYLFNHWSLYNCQCRIFFTWNSGAFGNPSFAKKAFYYELGKILLPHYRIHILNKFCRGQNSNPRHQKHYVQETVAINIRLPRHTLLGSSWLLRKPLTIILLSWLMALKSKCSSLKVVDSSFSLPSTLS